MPNACDDDDDDDAQCVGGSVALFERYYLPPLAHTTKTPAKTDAKLHTRAPHPTIARGAREMRGSAPCVFIRNVNFPTSPPHLKLPCLHVEYARVWRVTVETSDACYTISNLIYPSSNSAALYCQNKDKDRIWRAPKERQPRPF